MCGSQLLELVLEDFLQVDGRGLHVDSQPELRAIEVGEVVEQSLHSATAANEPAGSAPHVVAGVQGVQMESRHLDRLQGTAHVVPQYAQ